MAASAQSMVEVIGALTRAVLRARSAPPTSAQSMVEVIGALTRAVIRARSAPPTSAQSTVEAFHFDGPGSRPL